MRRFAPLYLQKQPILDILPFILNRMYQLTKGLGKPPEFPCQTTSRKVTISVCSPCFMLRIFRLIDHLSCSYFFIFKEHSIRLLHSFHTACYHFSMSDISTWLKRINCQDETFTCQVRYFVGCDFFRRTHNLPFAFIHLSHFNDDSLILLLGPGNSSKWQ